MTDNSSSESSQEGSHQTPQATEHDVPAQDSSPNGSDPVHLVNGVAGDEPEPQEEERTLTDHLNKKLLESFLARLDSGNMQLPPGARGSDPVEEEDDDFED